MLNVVAPGKLVLTFQSIPPYVVESLLALTLAVLLAVPLILRVQHLLDEPVKCTGSGSKDRAVVTHYPATVFADTASSSSAELQMGAARKAISTPVLQASGDNARDPRIREDVLNDRGPIDSIKRNDSILFVQKHVEHPVAEVYALDYDAYRHELIEAALRRQYDDYQPPGDVVLNSIHLNNNDSTVAVKLNDRYHHSFFDFVEEYYDAARAARRDLHPLDHFLVKGTQKPETLERATETRRVDVVSEHAGLDEKSPRISFYDGTAANGNLGQRRQRSRDLGSIMKKNSKIPKTRPSSAGAESTSRRSMLPLSSRRKSIAKSSRTTSSTDSINSKRDTLSGSPKRDDRLETLSSIDGGERESMNCTTASSIDSESVRSESSKIRDDHSCRSRDSSVASKRGTSSRPKVQPRLTGNPRVSFNKKYGSAPKASSKTPVALKRSSSCRRSGVLNKQAVQPSSEYARQTSNLSVSSKRLPKDTGESKEDLKSSFRGDEASWLEAIRRETEEIVRNDLLRSLVHDSSARRLNDPLTVSSKTRASDEMDSFVEARRHSSRLSKLGNVRSNEPRMEKKPEDTEFSTKLPEKQSQSDKFAKLYRNRRQRSRTHSPVLAKIPKPDLPMETNAPVDSNQRNERGKEAKENAKSLKEVDRKPQESRQGPSKYKPYARKTVHDPSRGRDEETAGVSKLPDDSGRRKSTGTKNLGAAAKTSHPKNAKASSGSRTLQQRTIPSKLNDTVTSPRSMQVRSSKSPSGDRKISKTERTDAGRKENGSDGLKLPRRDSKAGIAMQAGLKKYIKNVKRVLSNRDNSNIGELASLSLTDAILPDLESTLSSVEVQQVQNLLNIAEKKTEMMETDFPVFVENAL